MITWTERTAIAKEIRDWSSYALEVARPEFNGLPACPYAKAAWQDNKVDVVFKFEKEDYKRLYMALHNWDDSKELVIIADTAFIEDPEEFHEFVDNVNEAIANNVFRNRDLWVMGFHPYGDANELIDDGTFEGETDTPYAAFFVQRLSTLEEASDKLKRLGYYDKFDPELAKIYEVRKSFYRRLNNAGN